MVGHLFVFLVGVAALYFGADWMVRGAVRMASRLGLSAIVVGLTVVSFGTSAPELVVAVVAAVRDAGDLAMGNVLGSNLANIGLILGLTAVIHPLEVSSRVVSREVPFMLVLTVLIYPVVLDLEVGRTDGFVLLGILVGYLIFVFRSAESEEATVVGEYEQWVSGDGDEGDAGEAGPSKRKDVLRDLGLVAAGALGLVVGGHAIVEGATFLARALGVSEAVIGLSVVAIGTSLPELATCVVAALRDEADIAVGNVIGSNIFNLAAVLGAAAAIHPFTISQEIISEELPAVILVSALLLPMAWGGQKIRRWEGGILLASYVAVGVWVFWPL